MKVEVPELVPMPKSDLHNHSPLAKNASFSGCFRGFLGLVNQCAFSKEFGRRIANAKNLTARHPRKVE